MLSHRTGETASLRRKARDGLAAYVLCYHAAIFFTTAHLYHNDVNIKAITVDSRRAAGAPIRTKGGTLDPTPPPVHHEL